MGNIRSTNKIHSFWSTFGGIILIIVIMLIAFNFAFILNGVQSNSGNLSFSALLNWLGSVNSFSGTFNINSFTISGDWGVFDFLRTLLNIGAQVWGVIFWFGSNLLNLISFIAQFLVFLTGG